MGRALSIPIPGPGRKSLYRDEYPDQARKLCLLGATDDEMADFFGVTVQTLNNWKREHAAFFSSIQDGKVKADANVADSLYRRATGEFVKIEKLVKGEDGKFEAVRIKQYVPGDPQAAFRWLQNRRKQNWREKQEIELTGRDGGPIEYRQAAAQEVRELFGAEIPDIIIEPKR